MFSYGVLWLVAMIAFVVIECISYQLMSIWMAVGALAALIAYGLGADFIVQFIIFVVSSVVLIVLTRPFAKKFLNAKNEKTNVEGIPGKDALVVREIDNISDCGTVKIGGMEWSARSEDNVKIKEGEIVEVVRVEGVKVVVKRKETEE